jgi:hypothetical protein
MDTPESLYGVDAVLWALEEADDQLAYIGGQLMGIATANSADALGMTVRQYMTSDDHTSQAGEHNPSDKLADALYDELYDELYGHISHAQDCAKALATFIDG